MGTKNTRAMIDTMLHDLQNASPERQREIATVLENVSQRTGVSAARAREAFVALGNAAARASESLRNFGSAWQANQKPDEEVL
jgi:hypothetical protein